jgi:hypothetical protein
MWGRGPAQRKQRHRSEISTTQKLFTGVNDTAGKFFAGVNDTTDKTVLTIPACLDLILKNKPKIQSTRVKCPYRTLRGPRGH